MDKLVAAGPDAIQLNYGQADLLQDRPGRDKPALVHAHSTWATPTTPPRTA